MDWKKLLLEQGTKILESPELMRWMTDERVLKVAEGLMDAPERLQAAGKILMEGAVRPAKEASPASHPASSPPPIEAPSKHETQPGPAVRRRPPTYNIPVFDFHDGPEAELDGKRVILLSSSNYLGLAKHPKVLEAVKTAVVKYGTSTGCTRASGGVLKLHQEFEQRLATWLHKEAALIFSPSQMLDLKMRGFLLQSQPERGPSFLFTDGVVARGGNVPNLEGIISQAKETSSLLMVDEAHALGVIGPGGRGAAHHFGVQDDVNFIEGCFSHSLAGAGGFLAGSREDLDHFEDLAFNLRVGPTVSPPGIAAALASFELMQEEQWRIEKLHENVQYLRDGLVSLGLEVGDAEAAIIPIYIREDSRTVPLWNDLLNEYGICTEVRIDSENSREGSMLRISLMATHERSHLDRALGAFEKAGKKFGVMIK